MNYASYLILRLPKQGSLVMQVNQFKILESYIIAHVISHLKIQRDKIAWVAHDKRSSKDLVLMQKINKRCPEIQLLVQCYIVSHLRFT